MTPGPDKPDWQPGATLATLRRRAELINLVRQYFARDNILEVETPILSRTASSEVHLQSWQATPGAHGPHFFLHTSPELFMKRLLAAGSGDIYQMCKVFRADEKGRQHNPEFTLLEWYRVGFDLRAMCGDVARLLREILGEHLPVETLSYRQAFLDTTGQDPYTADAAAMQGVFIDRTGQSVQGVGEGDWPDLLFSALVQPGLPRDCLVFITHFPAAQASLAKLDPQDAQCALRFEVFYNGIELANGFEELTDPFEQRQRIDAEQARRAASGLPVLPVDVQFLAALAAGLPPCSGVALGVDRLVMLSLGLSHISAVLSFDVTRC